MTKKNDPVDEYIATIEQREATIARLEAENSVNEDNAADAFNALLRATAEREAMRPIVEAAVSLDAIAPDRDWENSVWIAHMDFWEPAERDALEALGRAVAAYRASQEAK